MKIVKLIDVATIEKPKKGKIYPIGSIIIQVSATRGQILYLRTPKEIEDKYVVIYSKEINSFYLFSIIDKFFPKFFEQRRQGLNFKAEELTHFQFPIHQEIYKQRQIGLAMKMMSGKECFY